MGRKKTASVYHLQQLQLMHIENVTEVKYMPYEYQLKFGGLKLLLTNMCSIVIICMHM